jgi:peroxisomal coenzyme A diphosphatase NUDT7
VQFREAYEEIELPLDCPSIQVICTLDPYISLHKLIVTPVVALLSDLSVLDQLKAHEDEVSHIFSHPLEALLDPSIMRRESLVAAGSEDWFYEEELHVRALLSGVFLVLTSLGRTPRIP